MILALTVLWPIVFASSAVMLMALVVWIHVFLDWCHRLYPFLLGVFDDVAQTFVHRLMRKHLAFFCLSYVCVLMSTGKEKGSWIQCHILASSSLCSESRLAVGHHSEGSGFQAGLADGPFVLSVL
jgi:hypothetical protein